MMLSELQKIKEKWIAKIVKNQKEFIKFLKEKNKLEDTIFIECLDECWRVNEDKISLFNEKFNIKNNLDVMSDESKKIVDKFKADFEVLEANFKSEENKIIESTNKEIEDNFQKCLGKINQSETKSIEETQTEINTEKGETCLLEQIINKQQKTIKILEFENENLQKTIISIKEINDDEVKELTARLREIEALLRKEQKETEKKCDELRNKLRSKLQPKKEEETKTELNESEIKLTYINQLLSRVSNKITSLQSENKNEQNWGKINLNEANRLDLQVKITSNVTNFDNVSNKHLII